MLLGNAPFTCQGRWTQFGSIDRYTLAPPRAHMSYLGVLVLTWASGLGASIRMERCLVLYVGNVLAPKRESERERERDREREREK